MVHEERPFVLIIVVVILTLSLLFLAGVISFQLLFWKLFYHGLEAFYTSVDDIHDVDNNRMSSIC